MEKIKNIKLPNGEVYELGGSGGLVIGQIISMNCTTDYVPEGCLPCNGSEYSKAQFNDLWNNYLTANLLSTCTYAEYEADLTTYGQCAKFAIDTDNETFKVPKIKDGAVVQQAMTDAELGKAYNAGLPNITGSYEGIRTGNSGNPNASGALKMLSDSVSVLGSGSGNANRIQTLGLDASNSNSIYGKSSTVQMNAVALRYFVVVANGQINESMMDWSAWASSINGKLNADLTNIDAIGKSTVSGWGMPGSKTASFSGGASGATYTAPANGYFVFGGKASSSSVSYLNAYIIETNLQVQNWIPPNVQGNSVRAFLPCKKGQRLNLSYYQLTLDVLFFRYADGEV